MDLLVFLLLLVVLAIACGVVAIVVIVARSTRQRQGAVHAPSPDVPNSIPPGWYDDGNGTTRWYDGQRWTPHTR